MKGEVLQVYSHNNTRIIYTHGRSQPYSVVDNKGSVHIFTASLDQAREYCKHYRRDYVNENI